MTRRHVVLRLACAAVAVSALAPHQNVLLVGVTGGTGPRAVLGLLDSGAIAPAQLHALSRNPDSPSCARLRARGIAVHAADLDDAASLAAAVNAVRPTFCYVHGTGGDTKALDRGETRRAGALAEALRAADSSLELLAYNSAAAEPGHRVARIRQKRECEELYKDAGLPLCALRANLFMEEFWKVYTRPSILDKRVFSFSVPPEKVIYLTCVRDMGRLAATVFEGGGKRYDGFCVDVASDAKTPRELADAFGARFRRARLFYWLSRFLSRELYQILRFYRTSTLAVDVDRLHRDVFPDVAFTDFPRFLQETNWADRERTYETLINDL